MSASGVRLRYIRRGLAATTALAALLALLAGQAARGEDGLAGFSITVDGETVAGDLAVPEADVGSEPDISVTYDGFDVAPVLAVDAAAHPRRVEFRLRSNYPAFIDAREILVFRAGEGTPVDVLPVGPDGFAEWRRPETGEFTFMARVYDGAGRFNETGLRAVPDFSEGPADRSTDLHDQTAFRSIPVHGGGVTIRAAGVSPDAQIVALGEQVTAVGGDFVMQRILPPGDHLVDVALAAGPDDAVAFSRAINIPAEDWFYVGLAEATVGTRLGSGAMMAADPGEYAPVYARGRAAFYLKGKIRGDVLLTAAADSSEGDLAALFTGAASKDPRQLLRRIDPDSFYPIYGDGSEAVDDAPTSGKFYVRLERGDSHVMWGNFKTRIRGTHFLGQERALYGGSATYSSDGATNFGEKQATVTAYAAQPGTLPQRDVLRGTGGSAYFLKQQDISIGSETVTVETRDLTSGVLLSRRTLVAGRDYRIDYVQGVIILEQPLASRGRDDAVVRADALGGSSVDLVVQYAFTPALGDAESYALGGRAESWINDHIGVGITGISEKDDLADGQLAGADLRLRLTEGTFLEAEIAGSRGAGPGEWYSTDGGLTFTQHGLGTPGQSGLAYRLRGEADLAELTGGAIEGTAGAYFEHRDTGFTGTDRGADEGRTSWGAQVSAGFGEGVETTLGYEQVETSGGKRTIEGSGEVKVSVGDSWTAAFGATAVARRTPGGTALDNGWRSDAGLRLSYVPDDRTEFFVFGQGTVLSSPGFDRNDRVGVGGEVMLTEEIGIEGEVSYGTTGLGALAGVTYDPTTDEHYYAGYRLDPDKRHSSLGQSNLEDGGFVVGAKRRYNEVASVYGETNYGPLSGRRSLTNAYGVTLTPDGHWTVSGGVEAGQIIDPDASDFDRRAISAGVAYDDETLSADLKGEARLEDSSDDTRDRQTVLAHAGLGFEATDDWKLIGSVDAVISRSDQAAILDGDYVEADVGFAYRPADNNWVNALFKYSFLYDLPGSEQVTAEGTSFGPRQRSHVLSADANLNLNSFVTVGGKVGFRLGEVSTTRASSDFIRASAYLAVLRADLHLPADFDLLIEGRVLGAPESGTTDWGALAALYRDFGNNVSVGAGYNFGVFSDDLTDLTYDDQGAFLNVLSKF